MDTRYLLIRIGKNKVKIRKDAKGYSDFLKAFCQKLKIEGYSRGGKMYLIYRSKEPIMHYNIGNCNILHNGDKKYGIYDCTIWKGNTGISRKSDEEF